MLGHTRTSCVGSKAFLSNPTLGELEESPLSDTVKVWPAGPPNRAFCHFEFVGVLQLLQPIQHSFQYNFLVLFKIKSAVAAIVLLISLPLLVGHLGARTSGV